MGAVSLKKKKKNEAQNERKGRIHGQNKIVKVQSGQVRLLE